MSALIEVNQLNIKSKEKHIIQDFSLELQSGEFVAITGPSGSGKSTILKFLAQLLDPNLNCSGQYTFEGKKVNDMDPIELRKQVSYCFQSPNLFGESVRDNLSFPYDIRNQEFNEDKARELLDKLQLPTSYLDKSIHELSGGEKQRVALIRNLLFEPKVLLLDEVTSALDVNTREKIWQGLSHLRQEKDIALVMVSHHESEQDLADRRLELSATKELDKEEKDSEQ
ncbi:ABC transporter ATP-binding protein [Ignavigranum ruoffiae]|uniref:Putative ABC transport system ATP-binding protein n=1 Tax=Ignavigranum ruoffiae TaxID=89093 RepID=A0A1H9AMY8_9LACT|nr:ATP-binding cassette domain-containing protein [Ignavigranum ruoffiae]SEP78060.1 putative ABC transport system ATP-binding protein [Ignavigranum ruoffiae]